MTSNSLLLLPDELLLEICKYLHPGHIFNAFYGLNSRLNRCVSEYCQAISLTALTYDQCHRFCRSILPAIGAEIRSLSLNNCASVLEGKLFAEYFADRMSKTFPNLEKLTLTCFAADEFDQFVHTLRDLSRLTQIEVHDLLTDQTDVFQRLIDTNDQRWTSIHFKTNYLDPPKRSCPNLRQLTFTIRTLHFLPDLLVQLPQIEQLNVTVDEVCLVPVLYTDLSPLEHLRNLNIRCVNHFWILDEFRSLFRILPKIEIVSFQISSEDEQFVNSEQKFFEILPPTVIQLNLSIRYFYGVIEEIDCQALREQRFPLVALFDEDYQQAFLHTIPYRFSQLNLSFPMSKQMSLAEHYRDVQMFYDYHGLTLAETFPILSRCQRIQEIVIQCYDEKILLPIVNHSQIKLPPRFPYLKRLWLLHSSREIFTFKLIIQIAPNLSELFISVDNLLPMFDDAELCQLLGQRIMHLLILRSTPSCPKIFSEEILPNLVHVFTRLRHLQIDVTHGPSVDSIVLAILRACTTNRLSLISLVVEGSCLDEQIKVDARQWLMDRACFSLNERFDARYKEETKRFLLWKSD